MEPYSLDLENMARQQVHCPAMSPSLVSLSLAVKEKTLPRFAMMDERGAVPLHPFLDPVLGARMWCRVNIIQLRSSAAFGQAETSRSLSGPETQALRKGELRLDCVRRSIPPWQVNKSAQPRRQEEERDAPLPLSHRWGRATRAFIPGRAGCGRTVDGPKMNAQHSPLGTPKKLASFSQNRNKSNEEAVFASE